jgi:hypothetical protein
VSSCDLTFEVGGLAAAARLSSDGSFVLGAILEPCYYPQERINNGGGNNNINNDDYNYEARTGKRSAAPQSGPPRLRPP